jgi:L-fuconolactonase
MLPDQPFVLDHLAKPNIKSGGISPWNQHIRELAQAPNVWCKVSGMVTEADWLHWKPSDFTPYTEVVLDAFGTKRLMFGSDWPVCQLAGNYSSVHDLVASAWAGLSAEELAAVWGGNCAAFYGLK